MAKSKTDLRIIKDLMSFLLMKLVAVHVESYVNSFELNVSCITDLSRDSFICQVISY